MRIWLATAASLSAILSVPTLADIDPLSGAPLPPKNEEIASPITDHFYALAGVYAASAKTHLRLDPNNSGPGVLGTPLDGEHDLGLPEHGGFILDAQTRNGSLENDFGLETQSDDNLHRLNGKVGAGGPQIRVETTDGDVTIRGVGEGVETIKTIAHPLQFRNNITAR